MIRIVSITIFLLSIVVHAWAQEVPQGAGKVWIWGETLQQFQTLDGQGVKDKLTNEATHFPLRMQATFSPSGRLSLGNDLIQFRRRRFASHTIEFTINEREFVNEFARYQFVIVVTRLWNPQGNPLDIARFGEVQLIEGIPKLFRLRKYRILDHRGNEKVPWFFTLDRKHYDLISTDDILVVNVRGTNSIDIEIEQKKITIPLAGEREIDLHFKKPDPGGNRLRLIELHSTQGELTNEEQLLIGKEFEFAAVEAVEVNWTKVTITPPGGTPFPLPNNSGYAFLLAQKRRTSDGKEPGAIVVIDPVSDEIKIFGKLYRMIVRIAHGLIEAEVVELEGGIVTLKILKALDAKGEAINIADHPYFWVRDKYMPAPHTGDGQESKGAVLRKVSPIQDAAHAATPKSQMERQNWAGAYSKELFNLPIQIARTIGFMRLLTILQNNQGLKQKFLDQLIPILTVPSNARDLVRIIDKGSKLLKELGIDWKQVIVYERDVNPAMIREGKAIQSSIAVNTEKLSQGILDLSEIPDQFFLLADVSQINHLFARPQGVTVEEALLSLREVVRTLSIGGILVMVGSRYYHPQLIEGMQKTLSLELIDEMADVIPGDAMMELILEGLHKDQQKSVLRQRCEGNHILIFERTASPLKNASEITAFASANSNPTIWVLRQNGKSPRRTKQERLTTAETQAHPIELRPGNVKLQEIAFINLVSGAAISPLRIETRVATETQIDPETERENADKELSAIITRETFRHYEVMMSFHPQFYKYDNKPLVLWLVEFLDEKIRQHPQFSKSSHIDALRPFIITQIEEFLLEEQNRLLAKGKESPLLMRIYAVYTDLPEGEKPDNFDLQTKVAIEQLHRIREGQSPEVKVHGEGFFIYEFSYPFSQRFAEEFSKKIKTLFLNGDPDMAKKLAAKYRLVDQAASAMENLLMSIRKTILLNLDPKSTNLKIYEDYIKKKTSPLKLSAEGYEFVMLSIYNFFLYPFWINHFQELKSKYGFENHYPLMVAMYQELIVPILIDLFRGLNSNEVGNRLLKNLGNSELKKPPYHVKDPETLKAFLGDLSKQGLHHFIQYFMVHAPAWITKEYERVVSSDKALEHGRMISLIRTKIPMDDPFVQNTLTLIQQKGHAFEIVNGNDSRLNHKTMAVSVKSDPHNQKVSCVLLIAKQAQLSAIHFFEELVHIYQIEKMVDLYGKQAVLRFFRNGDSDSKMKNIETYLNHEAQGIAIELYRIWQDGLRDPATYLSTIQTRISTRSGQWKPSIFGVLVTSQPKQFAFLSPFKEPSFAGLSSHDQATLALKFQWMNVGGKQPHPLQLEFWKHYGRFLAVQIPYEAFKIFVLYQQGKITKEQALAMLEDTVINEQAIARYYAFVKIDGFSQKQIRAILWGSFEKGGLHLFAKITGALIFRQTLSMMIASGTLEVLTKSFYRMWEVHEAQAYDGMSKEDWGKVALVWREVLNQVDGLRLVLNSIGFAVGTTLGSLIPIPGVPLLLGFFVSDLAQLLTEPIRTTTQTIDLLSQKKFVSTRLKELGLSCAPSTCTTQPWMFPQVYKEVSILQQAFARDRLKLDLQYQNLMRERSDLSQGRMSGKLTRMIEDEKKWVFLSNNKMRPILSDPKRVLKRYAVDLEKNIQEIRKNLLQKVEEETWYWETLVFNGRQISAEILSESKMLNHGGIDNPDTALTFLSLARVYFKVKDHAFKELEPFYRIVISRMYQNAYLKVLYEEERESTLNQSQEEERMHKLMAAMDQKPSLVDKFVKEYDLRFEELTLLTNEIQAEKAKSVINPSLKTKDEMMWHLTHCEQVLDFYEKGGFESHSPQTCVNSRRGIFTKQRKEFSLTPYLTKEHIVEQWKECEARHEKLGLTTPKLAHLVDDWKNLSQKLSNDDQIITQELVKYGVLNSTFSTYDFLNLH